jgi:hypothetical protein
MLLSVKKCFYGESIVLKFPTCQKQIPSRLSGTSKPETDPDPIHRNVDPGSFTGRSSNIENEKRQKTNLYKMRKEI